MDGDQAAAEKTLLADLTKLAEDNIVRGGIFGLTGNAYLVTRADEVVDRLLELGVGKAKSTQTLNTRAEKAELVREGEKLLAAAEEWEAAVAKRRQLAPENKRGDAPKGQVWLCPKNKKFEI